MQTSARDASPRRRHNGLVAGAALAILVVGFALPLLVAGHYHALGIPRGDDWSYLVTEFRWIDTGRLSFNHWVSMTLLGQLALAAPVAALLPRDIGALQVFTATVGTIGLLAVWVAARAAGIGRGGATLLTLTIAAGPLWAPLAVSFMTDVPAFAASAVATALAFHAVRRAPVRLGWIWAAVAAAVVACSIRQYAVVTLAAVLALAWRAVGDDRRARRAIVVAGIVAVAAVAVLVLWWRTIPDGRAIAPGFPDSHAISVLVSKGAGFVRLAGLLLLPVLVACRPVRRLRAAWHDESALTILTAGVTAAWLAFTALRVAADLFVGNYLVHDGVLSDIVLIGPRPDVLPAPVWAGVVLVASVAGIVLALIAVHVVATFVRARVARIPIVADPVAVLLGVTVVGYLGAYVVAMLTGVQVYDRYILPLLPAAGIALLRAPVPVVAPTEASRSAGPTPGAHRRRATIGAAIALVALAVLGAAFATDAASFDGARWRAADAAVVRGWPASQVNGGFEWRNYHRRDKRPPRRGSAQRICVTVHVDPRVDRGRIVAVVRSTAPTRGTTRLVAYRVRAKCATPPAP